MSWLGPVLNTCFELLNTTSPSRPNTPKHTPFSLQEVVTFRGPQAQLSRQQPWPYLLLI